jgi:hypothetical protein
MPELMALDVVASRPVPLGEMGIGGAMAPVVCDAETVGCADARRSL